jgi:hypothetical protein
MSKTTTAGIQSVERRLHTRHRARTTVYITTPSGRKKLCRAINLSATGVFVETTNLGLRKGQQDLRSARSFVHVALRFQLRKVDPLVQHEIHGQHRELRRVVRQRLLGRLQPVALRLGAGQRI